MGTHSDTPVLTVPRIDNPQKFSRTETVDREELRHEIELLGDWFHNLDLYGVSTAPKHFLGDFPNVKWKPISTAIPEDLTGASQGWYDVTIRVAGRASFAKRYAGRVETGNWSVSDPLIGQPVE